MLSVSARPEEAVSEAKRLGASWLIIIEQDETQEVKL